jgi:PAS domain S-box-containing protein
MSPATLHLLILEDEPNDAELEIAALEEAGYVCDWDRVETREDFLERLNASDYDLILSDYALPAFDGLTALSLHLERQADVPFILVSGTLGEEAAIASLTAGATDYVLKTRLSRLGPVVQRALKERDARRERQRTDEALRASEAQLRMVFEAADNVAFVTTRLDGKDAQVVGFSAGAEQIFGYSSEEIIGQNPARLHPPEAVEDISAIDKALREGRKGFDGETVLVRKSGENFPAMLTIHPRLDASGELIGTVEVSLDMTASKQAEAERVRLMAAVEQAAETIVITDAKGHIEYVNPAFEKTSGYASEEVIGQNLRILQSGEQDPEFYDRMWEALLHGEAWAGQLINRKKDGSLFTEEATISPVRDAAGKTVNYVAVKHDVTERIKLENQFRQAQKMESLGQLVGGVAHDFNNLLQIISGHAELAAAALDPTQMTAENIHEITRAGELARDLVKQLLAFSRQQLINPVNVDLNEEVGRSKKMLSRMIGENIEFRFIAGDNPGLVFFDKSQLQQLLMNLCVNARDAMPDGGTLTIQTEAAAIGPGDLKTDASVQPGDYVLLTVSDTGCGMDEQTCRQIFEPFFTTKEKEAGTGMGLSTVYGIIKQNNGEIEVCSRPGEGTVFKVYLPVSSSTSPAGGAGVSDEGAAASHRRGSETLLVAEDDEMILNFSVKVLRNAGYQVLTAKDGEDALRVFEEHADEIDLVMMDVVMPRMGGKEAMEEILKNHPHLRYLFVSGYNADTGHTNFIEKAGDRLLGKPYKIDVLLRRIRALLDAE